MRKSVREENNEWVVSLNTHLKHAAIVGEAFELIGYAHAELFGTSLHGAADHEAIARFKHMQRTGDCGEGHCANKDGHFLV